MTQPINQTRHTWPTCPLHEPICKGSDGYAFTAIGSNISFEGRCEENLVSQAMLPFWHHEGGQPRKMRPHVSSPDWTAHVRSHVFTLPYLVAFAVILILIVHLMDLPV